jgi:protein-tyrosine phosphatase
MKVLFVCLGNICRSPMAAAIFKHKIQKQGLSYLCDSCGTGDYHIGGPADYRTLAVSQKNGVAINHTARQLCDADLKEFDYIFAMDKSNQFNILQLPSAQPNKNKVKLMREYDPNGLGDVPDPYHGNIADFQEVFEMLDRSIDQFVNELQSKAH